MTALEWLRSKSTTTVETMTIAADEAFECAPGEYKVVRQYFRGRIPARMVYELRNAKLTVTDTMNEVLKMGGQYRSDFGKCEYWFTTYEKVGA